MRDFNDADRKKKSHRIRLPNNPGNLSGDALSQLEYSVKVAGKDGHIACPLRLEAGQGQRRFPP